MIESKFAKVRQVRQSWLFKRVRPWLMVQAPTFLAAPCARCA